MNDLFDPLQLDGTATLNRTSLRNEASFGEAKGRLAGTLLSSAAMARVIQSEAAKLGLTEAEFLTTPAVALLDACLSAKDAAIRSHAQRITNRFGEYLAFLLVTLVEGTSDGYPWPSRPHYLRHWTTIEHVRLGGGNMRGRFGGRILESVEQSLASYGHRELDVQRAADPQMLALVGAARSVGGPGDSALVYDFGGTAVKHAVARYAGADLSRLELKEPLHAMFLRRPFRRATARARLLARYMTGIVAHDWIEAGSKGSPSHAIYASIGSYVRDGQLLSGPRDTYGLLNLWPGRSDVWLSELLSKRLGQRASIAFSHDGTTAARVFAGQAHTAVIMLGTWLGVGFAPEDASGLRAMAPDFRVAGG